jgi:sugar phosphate isomerase/epimerase
MRLGGPIPGGFTGPEEWAELHTQLGYGAAYCPLGPSATDDVVGAYVAAADGAGLVIAEVGAWSNPLSPDEAKRKEARDLCERSLDLADRVGARCCVNIAGSLGSKWDGPDPRDLTPEAFDAVVECTRAIIDAVKPTRTFYTLETMPWMYPDSAESYLRLVEAVERHAFGVHLDPVNLICSPERYAHNAALVRDFVDRLGPRIRSCHAKDVVLRDELTVHLDEVPPGKGHLDYAVFLTAVDGVDPDMPVMLEHLQNTNQYRSAAEHIRSVAAACGLTLR